MKSKIENQIYEILESADFVLEEINLEDLDTLAEKLDIYIELRSNEIAGASSSEIH